MLKRTYTLAHVARDASSKSRIILPATETVSLFLNARIVQNITILILEPVKPSGSWYMTILHITRKETIWLEIKCQEVKL